jgi:hypothetical protein
VQRHVGPVALCQARGLCVLWIGGRVVNGMHIE